MRITTPVGMLPRGPQTVPVYFDNYGTNGLGVVARRGWDGRTTAYIEQASASIEGLYRWCQEAPLRLLEVLVDLHPMGVMADSNDKTLAFAPGSTRIVAVKDYREGRGTVDDDTTRLIADMLDASGGISHLQHVQAAQVNVFGLAAIEVAIDRERGALATPKILDIDPLSLRYRDTDSGERVLEQRNDKAKDGWQKLDTSTIYHRPWMGDRKNPYGKPRYRSFLSEGLADISEQRNLKDWLRAAALPRMWFGFPFQELAQWAQDHDEVLIGLGPEVDGVKGSISSADWALAQINAFADKMTNLKADDVIISPSGSEADVISAGSVTGLADVLEIRRLRVIQSLDQLPTLMGVTSGGTQAYALANWGTQTDKLNTLRTIPNDGLVFAANLFLRLMGIDMIARADTLPIRSIDPKADAEARSLDIDNELKLVDRGLLSPEDAAVKLTGTGVFDLTRVYGTQTATNPTPPTGTTA